MYCIEEAFAYENNKAYLITLENQQGIKLKLLSYGACLVELWVPDKKGVFENIVLTHEKIEDYIKNPSYFGATIGRTAGRIANGTFRLGDKDYLLNKNYGVNHGHGGPRGFAFQLWDFKIIESSHSIGVQFYYCSKDGEEKYPGNLSVEVTYTLERENQLTIEYRANTDKPTLCNLTNHSYFNLSGNQKRKVTQQVLTLRGDYFLELNDVSIPTGKWIEVTNTPMDFRRGKFIGQDIENSYQQLRMTGGYDHPWILNRDNPQIEMIDPISGRRMLINTTYPSVVVYSYNFPNHERLKGGKIGEIHDGICFETQYEPDGINHSNFHSAILDPKEVYYEKTQYAFSTILK